MVRERLKFEQRVRKPALAFDRCYRRRVLSAFEHGRLAGPVGVRNRLTPQVLTENGGAATGEHFIKMLFFVLLISKYLAFSARGNSA
jgi:hypothetical protein